MVNVNDTKNPTFIQSEHFTGYIVVRVKDYDGVPGESGVTAADEYFKDTRDTCSIMFGGWFNSKGKRWSVDDVVFGVRGRFCGWGVDCVRMILMRVLRISCLRGLLWG